MDALFDIGPAREDETAFVLNSFKESYIHAIERQIEAKLVALLPTVYVDSDKLAQAVATAMRPELYKHFNALADVLFGQSTMVLVARDKSDKDFLYAWLAASFREGEVAFLYAFTKKNYRRMGALNALMRRMIELVPENATVVHSLTLKSVHTDRLEQMGFEHRPLREVLGERKGSA